VAAELTVRAGWALWGKEPGSRADYSVLACSPEPFSPADFGTIITRFAPGNPDSRAAGSGELPWVTMSWVGVDASLQIGIGITDNTGQVDAVGRPITQTSYFCVPYRELAPAGVSYSALYDAVAGIPLMPRNGGSIPLSVPAATTEEMAQRVETFGDRMVSVAAALLLRGPVSVVDAEGTTLRQRLEFIDAVASLLPYGLRAKLAAATWSDSGTRHRLRLAFASRPRDDAAALPWRHPGEIPGSDSVARAYFEQLRQLRSGSAAHGRKFDLGTVVAHLAARTEPQKFENPQEALAIAREIDLPDRVLRAVRDGSPVDLAELRLVTRPGPLGQLLPGERKDLLTALGGLGSAVDWPVLKPWLSQLPAEDRGTLCHVLARYGQRVLWLAEPDDDVLRDCLAAATVHGVDDHVLAQLVQPPAQAASRAAGIRYVAGLLAGRVLGSAEQYPATGEELARNPAYAAEYLAALASSGRSAGELLGWLAPQLPSDLTGPFQVALGASPGGVAERDIARLAGRDTACVRALLAAGSDTGRLGQLLPGFTSWLASGGEPEPGEQRYWSEHLRVLNPETPQLRAWLDTALLTIGAAPTALPPLAEPDSGAYNSTMTDIWAKLSRDHVRFSAERCVRALARYLRGQEWAARKAQAAAVTDLTGRLLGYDRQDVLAGAVGSALAAVPAAKRWDFARDWLARVRAGKPEAVKNGLLAALETAEPGTEPGQLARLCLQAYREGIPEDQALQMLARSGAIDSGKTAEDTVTAVHREFERSGAEFLPTLQWLDVLVRKLVLGTFGEPVRQAFRERMSRTIRAELRLQLTLFTTLADGDQDGHYEIADDERDELAEFREALETIDKKSRKRSLWRRAGNAVAGAQDSG
jgi:hypothetical protein